MKTLVLEDSVLRGLAYFPDFYASDATSHIIYK
jgi:hypothetical protein